MNKIVVLLVLSYIAYVIYDIANEDPIKEDCLRRGGAPAHRNGEFRCYDIGHKGINE